MAWGIACLLVFDVFARFSYTFTERALVMRWWILGFVPYERLTITLDDIAEARAGYKPGPLHVDGYLFGSLFRKGGLRRRCYVTPDEPTAFLATLRRRLAQRPGR